MKEPNLRKRNYFKESYIKLKRHGFIEMIRSIYNFGLSRILLKFSFANRFLAPSLRSLSIELTNHCNLKCSICYIHKDSSSRKEGFMALSLFIKIFDELDNKIKCKSDFPIFLNFAGESLLHKQFKFMLSYAASKGFRNISLSTNGNLLNPDIAKSFLNYSQGGIKISLDGFKKSHETIRKGSDYNKVMRNLKYLVTKRNEPNKNKPLIVINLVKSGQTDLEIQNFIEEWINIVDCVSINDLTDPKFRYVTRNNILDSFLSNNKRLPCLSVFHGMSILWNGEVTMCCHDWLGDGKLDTNVLNEGVMGVWKSKNYREIRQTHSKRNFSVIPICRDCEAWVTGYINISENQGKIKTASHGAGMSYMAIKNDMERKRDK